MTARLHLASVARIRPPGERLDVQAERKRIAQTTAALAAECEMPNPLTPKSGNAFPDRRRQRMAWTGDQM